jgi:hypothetical protein
VNVSVDQAGRQIAALEIDGFSRPVPAETHYHTVGNGHICFYDLIGKHRNNAGVLEQKIRRFPACRDIDAMF